MTAIPKRSSVWILDPGWNEVDGKHRLATYTNLDPGKYVFRVQGSNSDGVWNEGGVSLPILIRPPWWGTTWFRASCVGLCLVLLAGAFLPRYSLDKDEPNSEALRHS